MDVIDIVLGGKRGGTGGGSDGANIPIINLTTKISVAELVETGETIILNDQDQRSLGSSVTAALIHLSDYQDSSTPYTAYGIMFNSVYIYNGPSNSQKMMQASIGPILISIFYSSRLDGNGKWEISAQTI